MLLFLAESGDGERSNEDEGGERRGGRRLSLDAQMSFTGSCSRVRRRENAGRRVEWSAMEWVERERVRIRRRAAHKTATIAAAEAR